MGNNKLIKASDCKCCLCGKQAVAFWPVFDPDIPSHPYCRECLDKTKLTLMIEFDNVEEKYHRTKEEL